MRHQYRALWVVLDSTRALGAAHYDLVLRVFLLCSLLVSYAFGVNERGELQFLYWGASLDAVPAAKPDAGAATFDPSTGSTPQEYPAWGAALYSEPALKVSFPDGNRDLLLHYLSHTFVGSFLCVLFLVFLCVVRVELRYDIDPDSGILARSAHIENHTGKSLSVQQAAAATWNLPAGQDYTLHSLSGRWAAEWQLDHRPVVPSQTILESRRGSTAQQNNPWFALTPAGTTENAGPVWFGALAWSGSWRITVEPDFRRRVRVTGGYNPFDFSYRLAPGESLDTPVFFAGYTSDGMGEMSRLLHRFELAHVLPQTPHPRVRPVLYNSWEATQFNVDEAGQARLAEMAARIGVERFVMDDGWFGARNNDHAGLGDWVVNPKKFPHGLQPLIERVHALGMDFGLWVEPEMVNPDSDLYRLHPDWVLNFPGRPRTQGRNQLVLNLARRDVRDHLFLVLDELLTRNDIAFLKWDYNRNWSEPGWPEQKPEDQQKDYVEYVRNLKWILQRLREKHPEQDKESCSGGGGRVDLGIMRLTEEVWPSDNTDPFARLSIQDGFTYAYTPGIMMAWVTDSPSWANQRSTSLEYRFLSSMQGSLGIGADLNHWNDQDFATAARLVADYKNIRMTVQQGRLYRLISPRDGSSYSATESVSIGGGQAVLFAFLHTSSLLYPYPRIQLQGLVPLRCFCLCLVVGFAVVGTPVEASGAHWMTAGIELALRGDFQAAAVVLDRVR